MKGYKPGSPYLKYYEYIKEHGYSRHLYEFKDEYANMPVDVQKDEEGSSDGFQPLLVLLKQINMFGFFDNFQ